MSMIADLHQPYHNIIRFSPTHPEGDNFGKAHKIDHENYTNIFDLYEDAFGQYKTMSYPLNESEYVNRIALNLTKAYSFIDYNDINIDSKQKWSRESYKIAKEFGYDLTENSKPSEEYLSQGKDLLNHRLVLAGKRLSKLISQMMQRHDSKVFIESVSKTNSGSI